MGSYMSFSDETILDGTALHDGSLEDVTGVTISRGTLPTSTSTPTKEEPAEGLASLEVATEEVAPAGKLCKGPTHPPVAVNDSAEGLTAPQAQHKEQGKLEAPHSGYPSWMKVLHPSQPVTAAEPIPLAHGGLKGRHHSWSMGAGEPIIEEWKNTYKPWYCIPCHHPSPTNWYERSHHPLASWGW